MSNNKGTTDPAADLLALGKGTTVGGSDGSSGSGSGETVGGAAGGGGGGSGGPGRGAAGGYSGRGIVPPQSVTRAQAIGTGFVPKAANHFARRKFGYEREVGVPSTGITVDREDTMSLQDAVEVFSKIRREFGVDTEPPQYRAMFDDALLLYAAVNQSSVLNPAGAKFYVNGMGFEYSRVLVHLRPNPRRFFRVYADEMRRIVRSCLAYANADDPASIDVANFIRQTAVDRGMERSPDLCFDVAEYCTDLNQTEIGMIKASKTRVIGGAVNSADKVHVARPQAISQYDNTAYTEDAH